MLKKKTTNVAVKTDDDTKASAAEAVPETAAPATEAAPTAETEAAPVAKDDTAKAAPEKEPETVVEKEVPAETSKEVATAQQQTGMVASSGNFADQSAEEGFEGMELGYFSYPVVKLPSDGIFETSTGVELGKYVDVQIISTRSKFLIKVLGAPSDDDRVAYSYDPQAMTPNNGQVLTTDGVTLDALKADWGEEALEVKKYLDAPAMLKSADLTEELDGTLVMLSIPPSGIQRLSGHKQTCDLLGKGKLNEITTRCSVGKKVKLPSGNSFYPWIFEYVAS